MGIDLYPGENGLAALIDRHAEEIYQALPSPEVKRAAELLFRAITDVTTDGRYVRRAQPLTTIAGDTGVATDELGKVIDAFAKEGLLKPAGAVADIAHEAIARQWRRLGPGFLEQPGDVSSWHDGWIVVEQRTRAAAATLAGAAREWKANDENPAYVFRGARLQRLIADLGGRIARISPLERRFLDAGQRATRRDRLFSRETAAAFAIAVAIVVAVWFQWQRNQRLSLETTVAQTAATNEKTQADLARLQTGLALARANIEAAERVTVETAYRQAKAGKGDEPPMPVAAPSRARLYTQVWSAEQETQIKTLLEKLPKADVIASCCERVSVGPNHDELRYFRKSEADEAARLAKVFTDNGRPVKAWYVSGFESSRTMRSRHFELWLARPSRVAGDTRPAGPVITSIAQEFQLVQQRGSGDATVLRIVGANLDSQGTLTIDGRSFKSPSLLMSVRGAGDQDRFGADLLAIIQPLTLFKGSHSVVLTNADGQSATASFTVTSSTEYSSARD
jgi:hypothetical protein